MKIKTVITEEDALQHLKATGFCLFCGDGFVEEGANGYYCTTCGLGKED